MLIGRELDDRGITTPAAIGAALGMPAAEATKLLRGINGVRATSRGSRLRRRGWGCRYRASPAPAASWRSDRGLAGPLGVRSRHRVRRPA